MDYPKDENTVIYLAWPHEIINPAQNLTAVETVSVFHLHTLFHVGGWARNTTASQLAWNCHSFTREVCWRYTLRKSFPLTNFLLLLFKSMNWLRLLPMLFSSLLLHLLLILNSHNGTQPRGF